MSLLYPLDLPALLWSTGWRCKGNVYLSDSPSTLSLLLLCGRPRGPVGSVECGTMRESATRTTTGVLRQFAAAFSGIHLQYKYIMYSETSETFCAHQCIIMKTLRINNISIHCANYC